MRRNIYKHIIVLLVVILAGTILFPPRTIFARENPETKVQAAGSGFLCIVNKPDATHFPEVTLNFRLLEAGLTPVDDLSTLDLRISENDRDPVKISTDVQLDPKGSGISYYMILDKGNRADQATVKGILQSFLDYADEKIDKIKIYTNEKNLVNLYYPGSSGNTLGAAIQNFPEDNIDNNPRQSVDLLDAIVAELEANPGDCQRMRVVIFVLGDDAFPTLNEFQLTEYARRLKASFTKVVFLHLPNPKPNTEKFASESLYRDFVEKQLGGYYRPVISLDDGSIRSVFDTLVMFHHTFTATYHSNYGVSGTHQLAARYSAGQLLLGGESSYSIQLQKGQILPLDDIPPINRAKDGNSYTVESKTFPITITWPDGYIRDLQPKANLIVTGSDGTEHVLSVKLTKRSEDTYEFTWIFGDLAPAEHNQFLVQIEVFDEFGDSILSPTSNVVINNSLSVEPTDSGLWVILKWIIYILAGIIGLLFVIGILLFVVWKKGIPLSGRSGEMISRATESIRDGIKKTIVGGGSNRKALVALHVIEGPRAMIGQNLNVFTESVKLGRDPQKTDKTFYDLETNTSVSGLHALIERINGQWRIVAISESRSETFVNGVALQFDKPYELHSGDRVRLGYLAMQPVEFEFLIEGAEKKPAPPPTPAAYPVPTEGTAQPIPPDEITQVPPEPNQQDLEKTNIEVPEQPSDDLIGISELDKINIKNPKSKEKADEFVKKMRGNNK